MIGTLAIIALFVAYDLTDNPSRDALLFAAVIVAINSATDRLTPNPYRSQA